MAAEMENEPNDKITLKFLDINILVEAPLLAMQLPSLTWHVS